jgi:transcriptional regulator with XRE-family HTH domain
MAIAPAIRDYLQDHGIKQTFIAEKCGWSKQKTSCIINGKSKITAEDYQALCKCIGVPYELFLED